MSHEKRPLSSAPEQAAPVEGHGVGYDGSITVSRSEGKHVLDYVRVLYRRRWLAGSAFVVAVLCTGLYSYTRIPLYEARLRVMIQPQRQNYGFVDVSGEQDANYFQSQYAILRSRTLVKKTMQSLGIWQDVTPAAKTEAEPGADSAGVKQAKPAPPSGMVQGAWNFVTGLFGGGAGAKPVRFDRTTAEARQVNGFVGGLVVTPAGGMVDLAYRSNDPEVAARNLNAHARAYVELNLEMRDVTTRSVSDWLSDRLVEQRQKYEASQTTLQRYREANRDVQVDERGSATVQGVSEMNSVFAKARMDRIEKEGLYTQLASVRKDPALVESFPPVASNAAVKQARVTLTSAQRAFTKVSEGLGARHPDYIKAQEAVTTADEAMQLAITNVVDGIESDFKRAKAAEEASARALDAQRREAVGSHQAGVELAVLTRDAESNRQMYLSLLDKANTAGLSSEIKTNNVRVLDDAEVPTDPIWPNTRANMQYGVVGGVLLGLALAFFFEYMDNRIKSPEELRTNLGLAFLGLVPESRRSDDAGTTTLISGGAPANFVEAFRNIRTNVLFSSAEEGTRILLVASAGPGEGKTLIATNLAIALAQAGQRVLIIDADLRRPRVHEVLGGSREPGLSNLIVGDAKASDVIRPTNIEHLAVLTAGHIPPNPAELLGSKRFKELLHKIGERFDWIVIDTAPVLVVTDANVIAHLATGVVFVASAEITNRHNARQAVEKLVAARAHFLGGVLNRVDLVGHSYYYAEYYRRDYEKYYLGSKRVG